MPNGRIWHGGKPKLSYKDVIEAYGAAMAGLPSQVAYGCWQKLASYSAMAAI